MQMKALVVDDEAPIRDLLTRILSANGWLAVGAASGEEALGAIKDTPFSFIFLDVDLGGPITGISLGRVLRKQFPGLRIVMMSGDPLNAARVAEAGLGSMLAKPFGIEEIPPLLRKIPRPTTMWPRKPTILLVEDDPSQLAECARVLREMGYAVHTAASAEEAICTVQDIEVDAILSDNILPGMTGLRSIPEFAKRSSAPVVIMTSHYNPECEKDALLLGAAAYLAKPLDVMRLHQRLNRIVSASTRGK